MRLTRDPEGVVVVDHPPRLGGRGVWLCPSSDCVARAIQRNAIARAFRGPVRGLEQGAVVGQMADRVTSRVRGLLAASGRARHVAIGVADTSTALRQGKARLVIVAADLSSRARAELVRLASDSSVPVGEFGERTDLGACMARSVVGALAIVDDGLGEAVTRELALLRGIAAERHQTKTKPRPEEGNEALERAT